MHPRRSPGRDAEVAVESASEPSQGTERMKRILIFAATNIAVLVVISAIVKLLGLDQFLAERGESFRGLLVLSAVFGSGGAFISLALSKTTAKSSMGAQVTEQPRDETE